MGKVVHKVQVARSELEREIFSGIGDFLFQRRAMSMVTDRLKLVYDLVGSKLGAK